MRKHPVITVLLTLIMTLGATIPTYADKREQDRSCTDNKSHRSDNKPQKEEKTHEVTLRGSSDADGTRGPDIKVKVKDQ